MKKVNLYLDSKYNPTDDVGAYAFYIESGDYKFTYSQTYSKTTGIRMEMIAFLEAVKVIKKEYEREFSILVYSKQETLIKALKRGSPKKRGLNPNEDLYQRGAIELKGVLIEVLEKDQLNRSGLMYVESICEIAFKKMPFLLDKNEDEKPKGKPLF